MKEQGKGMRMETLRRRGGWKEREVKGKRKEKWEGKGVFGRNSIRENGRRKKERKRGGEKIWLFQIQFSKTFQVVMTSSNV